MEADNKNCLGVGEVTDLSLYLYMGNKWFKVGKGIN